MPWMYIQFVFFHRDTFPLAALIFKEWRKMLAILSMDYLIYVSKRDPCVNILLLAFASYIDDTNGGITSYIDDISLESQGALFITQYHTGWREAGDRIAQAMHSQVDH